MLALGALLACPATTAQAASWEGLVVANGQARRVFVPDLARPVKAVLVTNAKDPAANGRPDVLYANPALRILGARWNMMQMQWLGRPEGTAAITGEYEAIIASLARVGSALGKPEIAHTGIFIQGLSGTGYLAGQIANKAASRFGAIIAHHYSDGDPMPNPSIPCLYLVAGLDGIRGIGGVHLPDQLNTVASRVRNHGSPASLYLEPGNWHDTATPDQRLTAMWLEELLAQRFPTAIPTTSTIVLPSWQNRQAWFGSFAPDRDGAVPWSGGERALDNQIHAYPYSGTRTSYVWLPSQQVAQAWKASMDTGYFPTAGSDQVSPVRPAQPTASGSGRLWTVSGTTEPGATVRLYDTNLVATLQAGGDGRWSITLDLAPGLHWLTFSATDAAGNTSLFSPPVEFTTSGSSDTAAPSAPAAPTVDGSGTSRTVSGTTEAGAVVRIYDGGTLVATRTADGSGAWTTTLTLAAGNHTLAVDATDAAGNTSGISPGTTVMVAGGGDTTPPAMPAAPTVSGSGASRVVSGTTEPGALIRVRDGGMEIATVMAGSGGAWTTTVTLAVGSHTLTVTAADAAGNVSGVSPGTTVTIADTTPPATPAAPMVSGSGTSRVVSGTTEPGAVIRVRDGGVEIATTTAHGTGEWSVTVTLGVGTHVLTVTATDAPGNVSGVSPGTTVTVAGGADSTPPATPAAPTVIASATATPMLSGSTEPGATIRVYDGGTVVATTVAHGNGEWAVTVPLPTAGIHVLTVTATDAAGNASGHSPGVNVASPGGGSAAAQPDQGGGSSSCGSGTLAAAMLMVLLALALRLRRPGRSV